jgi:hypothetical protein
VTSVMGETILLGNKSQDRKKIQVCYDCYSPYIRSSVWLKILPEDLYVELLCFITGNWKEHPSQLQNVLFLKYMTSSGSTGLASVSNVANRIRIYVSSYGWQTWRPIERSGMFGGDAKYKSMPEYTQ